MTRKEVMDLLEILVTAYPYSQDKIESPQKLASIWQMIFAEDDAEKVFKAARYHMNTRKFFPTPADLREVMSRARISYDNTASPRSLPSGVKEEEDLIPLWEWACNLRDDY